jgi:hypothetical protein
MKSCSIRVYVGNAMSLLDFLILSGLNPSYLNPSGMAVFFKSGPHGLHSSCCVNHFFFPPLGDATPYPAIPRSCGPFHETLSACKPSLHQPVFMYSTLSQKQRIFPRNALECIWEQVPWPVNFRRRVNPPPFGNFRKHLTHLPSEISDKSREEMKIFYIGFHQLTFW